MCIRDSSIPAQGFPSARGPCASSAALSSAATSSTTLPTSVRGGASTPSARTRVPPSTSSAASGRLPVAPAGLASLRHGCLPDGRALLLRRPCRAPLRYRSGARRRGPIQRARRGGPGPPHPSVLFC
eukprot:4450532-Alexandrium_andersonii.AAC.1